tara:strand:+ start:1167 stop:1592 length:426 start_codon:yes stop_codon:yes gene_type:complete
LKSGKLRVVIRRSLKNTIVQFVEYGQDGDKILAAASSKELAKKFGMKGPRKNIPAAYLTGVLAGQKAKGLKIESAVADFGIRKPHPKGAHFAALKGIIDSGIDIPHGGKEESLVFPDESRLSGEHTKSKLDYLSIKSKIIK